MADTKNTAAPPNEATAAEAERRAVLKAIERILGAGGSRAAAGAQGGALAEISAALSSASPPVEQIVAEAWIAETLDAADVDKRLDALLARLVDTEARLDRQLARLGAEGG